MCIAINYYSVSMVSIGRIQKFLLADEIEIKQVLKIKRIMIYQKKDKFKLSMEIFFGKKKKKKLENN